MRWYQDIFGFKVTDHDIELLVDRLGQGRALYRHLVDQRDTLCTVRHRAALSYLHRRFPRSSCALAWHYLRHPITTLRIVVLGFRFLTGNVRRDRIAGRVRRILWREMYVRRPLRIQSALSSDFLSNAENQALTRERQ